MSSARPEPEDPNSAAKNQASAEFALLPENFAAGTGKRYAREDFLPLQRRALSEGDFVGRLRALFGPRQGDEYVLWHRETGFVVTAYAMQSGPAYGGGPRYPGEIPTEPKPFGHEESVAEAHQCAERVKADPILAKGRPRLARKHTSASAEELRAHMELERVWWKRFHDVSSPPGFAAVVNRLDQLVEMVTPVDWEVIRYWGDDPLVYRVGIRDGEILDGQLTVAEGLRCLLDQAEAACKPIKRTSGDAGFGLDKRVVDYWKYWADRGERVESEIGRVQASWCRSAKRTCAEENDELRDLLLARMREQALALAVPPSEMERVLSPAKKRSRPSRRRR